MTAALLAPPLPAQSSSTGAALHLDPYPLLCAAICVSRGRLKTIKHKGEVAVVLDTRARLRYLYRYSAWEMGREGFWVPRRAADRRQLRDERIRSRLRDKTLQKLPCWEGEARPPEARTVLLESAHRCLTARERVALSRLGFPFRAMVCLGSLPAPRLREPEPAACPEREWGEIVIIKTPFNEMDPDQRMRMALHGAVMGVLGGLRMREDTKAGVYDVVVLGKPFREVVEMRRLNAKSLEVTISRIRKKLF